jgi:hypothetical protein
LGTYMLALIADRLSRIAARLKLVLSRRQEAAAVRRGKLDVI